MCFGYIITGLLSIELDTCDPEWQSRRDELFISAFSVSTIASVAVITTAVLTRLFCRKADKVVVTDSQVVCKKKCIQIPMVQIAIAKMILAIIIS